MGEKHRCALPSGARTAAPAYGRERAMHNIIPVEAKSNKEHSAVSLGKFRRKFNGALHTPAVLHPKDLKTENGILHLPLYMTPLIA